MCCASTTISSNLLPEVQVRVGDASKRNTATSTSERSGPPGRTPERRLRRPIDGEPSCSTRTPDVHAVTEPLSYGPSRLGSGSSFGEQDETVVVVQQAPALGGCARKYKPNTPATWFWVSYLRAGACPCPCYWCPKFRRPGESQYFRV